MKESAKNALCKVQQLTAAACQKCVTDEPYRCCSTEFCQAVEAGLKAVGKEFPKTSHPTLQYMGEKGCMVPPELRPGCSGYVCISVLEKDRNFRREYERLHKKFQEDETVDKMLEASNRFLKNFFSFLKS